MELVQVLEKCNSLDDRYNAVIKYMENMGFAFTEAKADHINLRYRIMSNGSSIFVKTNFYRLNLCEADKDKLAPLNLEFNPNYKNKSTKELDQVRPYTIEISDESTFEAALRRLAGKNKRFEILDATNNISFHSTYEAINSIIGTEYTGWMRACWPNSQGNGKFRIWFPKLAKEIKGKLEPVSSDYLNVISEDWNELIFDDLNENLDENKHSYTGYDLIFAKEPNGGDYIFRGVYVKDKGLFRFVKDRSHSYFLHREF